MTYVKEATTVSLPLSKEANTRLEFLKNALGRKSKASLANEILELVIADFYEQLKDGGEGAEYTISMQKSEGSNKRLLWRSPIQQDKG